MGGTYQTEFQIPTSNCDAFFSYIQRDGFLCSEPFELQETECLARLSTPEMHDDEFWLCFLAASPSSASRDVYFTGTDSAAQADTSLRPASLRAFSPSRRVTEQPFCGELSPNDRNAERTWLSLREAAMITVVGRFAVEVA